MQTLCVCVCCVDIFVVVVFVVTVNEDMKTNPKQLAFSDFGFLLKFERKYLWESWYS